MGLFNFLFRKMCNRIFHVVDVDKSGFIEALEVEVAIYRMYNIINKRIPGWNDPPSRSEVLAALQSFDSNHDQRLDEAEFFEFSRSLVKNGPDMFFARVGRDAAVHTAIIPVATRGLQGVASASGMSSLANVPLHIAAPVVGSLFRAARALVPLGL
eukprot:jgi/Ulvmu1/1538/UM011_0268.1